MAKRRMISQEIIYDEGFNNLTTEAQNLFLRMLCVSDDYGIIPANIYTLRTLTNPPQKVSKSLDKYLNEIVSLGLGQVFTYLSQTYFMFKRESFDRINSYVLAKRTKSEYLHLSKEFIESEKFLEVLGNSSGVLQTSIISNKYKDISNKQKVESKKIEERMTDFELAVMEFNGEYPKEMLDAFWNYWSEPNQPKTKMRMELEQTWDTKKRLKTWSNNQKTFSGKSTPSQKFYTYKEMMKVVEDTKNSYKQSDFEFVEKDKWKIK